MTDNEEIDQKLKNILLNLVKEPTIHGNVEFVNEFEFLYLFTIINSSLHTAQLEHFVDLKRDISVSLRFYISFKSFYILECYIIAHKTAHCTRKLILSLNDFLTFKNCIFKKQNTIFNKRFNTDFLNFINEMDKYLDENTVINTIDDLK